MCPKKKHKVIRLPAEFRKYFWDVEFKKISPSRHLDFILSRIMNFGNMKAIQWMFKNVNENKLKDYVLRLGGRQLDKRSRNFWRILLGLPEQDEKANPLWDH